MDPRLEDLCPSGFVRWMHSAQRCRCFDRLEPIRRTYDADELGIDQEEDD